jgi:hypothetical protein
MTAITTSGAWPAPITLVTAPDCHYCAEGKAALERLGRAYPLAVHEVALDSAEGQALAARHGILFPPGLLLDGTFVGFGRVSERKVCRLLERRAQQIPIQDRKGGCDADIDPR